MSTISERLSRLGLQDDALLRWVDGFGDNLRDAWDACARGDWRLWLAAAAGVEGRELVRAAAACARHALERADAPTEPSRRAMDAVHDWLHGASDDGCAERADEAELSAERGAYRESASPGAQHAARAAAWTARAADATQTAEVRSSFVRASAEAGRLTKWMRAPSFFEALLPAESGALEHAVADDFAFAAAAAAEAVLEAAQASSEAANGSLDDALARCDRTVAEHIPRRVLESALDRFPKDAT